MCRHVVALREREEKFPSVGTAVAEPLPWELQGNSVDEILSVLGEVRTDKIISGSESEGKECLHHSLRLLGLDLTPANSNGIFSNA